MSKMTLKLIIEKKEYFIEEDKWYIFEFKPGYELGNSTSPFCKCRVIDTSFKGANEEVCFYVFHEESEEEYLIGEDELLSISNI